MSRIERLWEGRLLTPVTAATVRDQLELRDIRRCDVSRGELFKSNLPCLTPGQIAAVDLLAERGVVMAAELFKAVGGSEQPYWQLRSALQKRYYAVAWPDDPVHSLPMRIEGRIAPGVPRALWDGAAELTDPRRSPAVDIVGTLIEVIPLDASPSVVPLIAAFVGVSGRDQSVGSWPSSEFPFYAEPLTGLWAEWVERNRPMCEIGFGDLR